MVNLVKEALDFLVVSHPLPSEPPSGAQHEPCGGHPLARVACDCCAWP